MVTFDDVFLSGEHLYNIDNDNEGDDGVDESSSGKEEIKKMKPLPSQKDHTLLFIQINTWQLRKLKFDAIQIV